MPDKNKGRRLNMQIKFQKLCNGDLGLSLNSGIRMTFKSSPIRDKKARFL